MYYIPEEDVIFIPFNVPSSKNSRGISAQGYSFPSKTHTRWRRNTKNDWIEATEVFRWLVSEIKFPILAGFHFVRDSKRRYDWINPMQTIMDEMVKREWIEDDDTKIIYPFPLKIQGRLESYDKENPGVYIKILNQDSYDI